MSRSGADQQLKQRADSLAALLSVEQHPQVASEKLLKSLQELPQGTTTQAQVINCPLQRQNSRTAVHLAASKGLWQCLEVLLKNGGNPNALSSHRDLRQTPLHLAAREGNGKCIEVLLENGADYALENDRKESALKLSSDQTCRNKLENKIARLEIPKRNKSEEDVVRNLHDFIRDGESHLFFQLYTNQSSERMDLGTRWYDRHIEQDSSETLLYRACASEDDQIVEFILSKSHNQPLPNLGTGETPLHAAADNGNADIVHLLLQHSPKLLLEQTVAGRSPLHVPSTKGYLGVVDVIFRSVSELVRGMKHIYNDDNPFSLDFPDTDEVTPFYLACLNGEVGIVRQFQSLKKNLANLVNLTLNASPRSGHTALHAAASSGNAEVVELLLSTGEVDTDVLAPPILETKRRLWSCAGGSEFEFTDAMKIFESSNGRLVTDSEGLMKGDRPLKLTALAEACVHGHVEVMEVLLSHGVRDEGGLACRVLVTLQRFDLCQRVLGHHCKLDSTGYRGSFSVSGKPEDNWSLHLQWDGKKLPTLKREWLGKDAVFHPVLQGDEYDDDGHNRRQKTRSRLYSSLSPNLPKRIDHSFIRHVALKSNCLKTVPLQLFQLGNVTFIDLSDNQIHMLPTDRLKEQAKRCGWECQKLQELRLSNNLLVELPLSLWLLREITEITATYNHLKRLINASGFSTLYLANTLERVDFSHNDLTEIDPFITELYSLKAITVTNNRIFKLPLELWDMQWLQELKVSHNQLSELVSPQEPDEVDKSSPKRQSMEEESEANPVMAGATRVTGARAQIRPQMSRFPSLDPQKSMDPGSIPFGLNTTDDGIFPMAHEVSQLKKLDISNNALNEFPQDLACIAPSLEELTVSNNPGITMVELQFLPPTLKKLHARDCRIERFGNVLNKEQLKLIKQSCIRKAHRMQTCEHRNHSKLTELSYLNLKENRLMHFQVLCHVPPESGALDFGAEEDAYQQNVANSDLLYPALQNLDLSCNRLQGRFNPNVAHLTRIKAIQLNNNDSLQVIPYELGHLKKLKGFCQLNLKNLPELVQPPKDIQGQMCQQLLTFLAAGLKESEMYRTIKLYLVGKAMRGKSTLLRRLCNYTDKKTAKTVGIDIDRFSYAPKSMFGKGKEPVQFLVWDFAGQDQYHSTHHCFYSQRSLYLAVYRLTDGESGLEELDIWLRNIQLRASGCPVVILGTHMDKVSRHRVAELEEKGRTLYMNRRRHEEACPYPHVVDVVSVNCLKAALKDTNMEKLKKTLYDISTHVHIARDGHTLKYDPGMNESDPKALFQQQVPKSFQTLQKRCREYVEGCQKWVEPAGDGAEPQPQNGMGPACGEGRDPVMSEEEFRSRFSGLFNNDKEELDEAVSFLHLQGTLLHFDDHNLKDLYFLDPQWLAKLMADVIHPHGPSAVIDGVVHVSYLSWMHPFSDSLKQKYIQLLEKFEVVLKISRTQVLIPALLPDEVSYPQTADDLRDIPNLPDEFHVTVLRRFWLADFIHEGFWPRLICRIAKDQQIVKILRTLIGDVEPASPTDSIEEVQEESMLKWRPWKMGLAFEARGRTLLVVKEECNQAPVSKDDLEWLPAKKRIEIHVYMQDWLEVQNELQRAGKPAPMLQNTFSLPGIATQLLVKMSTHILSLAKGWFKGTLVSENIYIPCWKCYGQREQGNVDEGACREVCRKESRYFPVSRRGVNFPVYAFNHEKCIITAAQHKDLQCPVHGPVKVLQTAPDLIFWDLASLSAYEQDMDSKLVINMDKVLGRGGFGFVCEGELHMKDGNKKKVAVKAFLSRCGNTHDCSVEELLELSRQEDSLYSAYNEIRQEVSFLAVLEHRNLTRLVGVRTSPYMCLLLELAPYGSLSRMLKVYKKYDVVLEPVTLQASILQIASGMDYLHMQQIIHQDMKSANVLVWKFPSGTMPRRKRVEMAGNVWLKLTDYGISQVFTKPTMTLDGDPKGTPGFMAPELFGAVGQEISTEKIDVFAFGMVIYEMLSLHAPFASVEPLKRHIPIKNGERPHLKGKSLWSPLMAQSVMSMCWSHEPSDRPTMKEVAQWAAREEFSRLRAEMSIQRVESVSCACICRNTFDSKEDEEDGEPASVVTTSNGIGHNPVEESISGGLRFEVGYSSTLNDMDPCTEYTRLQYEQASFDVERNILPPMQDEHGQLTTDGSTEDACLLDSGVKDVERSSYVRQLSRESYSQVWLCDHKEKGGLMEILSFCDTEPSYWVFACRSRDQIMAICPVRNLMWIGTAKGILKLKHARSLNTKFKGELKTDGKSASNTFVLAIVHVEKTSSVLVSTNAGEIWGFSDRLTKEGLVIEERMKLSQGTNCYQMVVVEVQGSLEVWGTTDKTQLILFKKQGRGWMVDGQYRVECKQDWQFFNIAHAEFEDSEGLTQNHLWVSYRHKGLVVCWDLQNRQYKAQLDTTQFCNHSDAHGSITHPKVTTIATSGRKVLVGTDNGMVGVIDAETCQVLHFLHWHAGKVRALLVMPREVEPCVCPEIPLPEYERTDSKGTQLLARATTRKIIHQRNFSEPDLPSLAPDRDPSSAVEGQDADLLGRMLASVGNGKGGGVVEADEDTKNVSLLLWRC